MLVLHSRAREGSTSAVVTVAILVVAAVAAAVATVAAAVAVAHHFFSQGPKHHKVVCRTMSRRKGCTKESVRCGENKA